MEIEKKEKVKKILTRVWLGVTTFLSGLFVVAVAVGCSQKGNRQASAYYDESEYQYSYRYDYHKEYRNTQKAVVYDDENYQVTISANELNNYVWSNFNQYQYNYDNSVIYEMENQSTFIVLTLSDSDFDNGFSGVVFADSDTDYIVSFNFYDKDNKFHYYDNGDVLTDVGFSADYIFSINSTIYDDVKSAIQADIQANSVNPGTDFVNDIFTDMTNVIVGFTGSVGSGIVGMTALFYDSVNNQLTTLGLLSVIVVAVSLAYWLFRLIIGLIRMRG